jgi:hypothetical protein
MIHIFRYEPIYVNGEKTMYYVSEFGDVISINNIDKLTRLKVYETKIYTKKKNKKDGYLYVKLSIHGKTKAKFIHRLVAETYIPNPESKPEVNHIDGDKHNNYVYNLEWVTSKENKEHAKSHGLANYSCCEDCGRAKYSNKQIERACKLLSENKYTLKRYQKCLAYLLKHYTIYVQIKYTIKYLLSIHFQKNQLSQTQNIQQKILSVYVNFVY